MESFADPIDRFGDTLATVSHPVSKFSIVLRW